MIGKLINALQKEKFGGEAQKESTVLLRMLIAWVIAVVFVGMTLWNKVLAKSVTFVKPIQWYQFVGLIVLLNIMHPTVMCY